MAAADFNGDGKVDLAIANCPVSGSVVRSNAPPRHGRSWDH